MYITLSSFSHLCSFFICSMRLCFSLLRRLIWYSNSWTTSVCCYEVTKKISQLFPHFHIAVPQCRQSCLTTKVLIKQAYVIIIHTPVVRGQASLEDLGCCCFLEDHPNPPLLTHLPCPWVKRGGCHCSGTAVVGQGALGC